MTSHQSLQEPKIQDSWKSHLVYLWKLFQKIVFWIALLAIVFWLYDAVGNRRYASRIYIPAQEHYDVIAFGDSLTEGLGSEDLKGYVGYLEEHTGVPIFNQGVRRNTTTDLLARIDRDVLEHHPRVVIMTIGGNDLIHVTPYETILYNLESLFKKLTDAGITVIFAEVTDNTLFKKYNQQVKSLADRYGVVYIPRTMEHVFWNLRSKFDPLHPDDRGYVTMGERMLPVVQKVFEEQGILPVVEKSF
jgi:lysophospholipase L1-like esterase